MKILNNVLLGFGLVTVLLAQSDQCSCKWHESVKGGLEYFNNNQGRVSESAFKYYYLIENHKIEFSILKSSTDEYYTLRNAKDEKVADFDELSAAKKEAESLVVQSKLPVLNSYPFNYPFSPCRGVFPGNNLFTVPVANASTIKGVATYGFAEGNR